jgi:acyl-CoA thioesterase II
MLTGYRMATTDRESAATERAALFAFVEMGEDHFRAMPFPSGLLRLYGGQVVAQALAATQRTVQSGRLAHSCHAYFASPGDVNIPLDFRVTRDRDGRSFSTRRVIVEQQGTLILTLSASFHDQEDGARQQLPMPDVAPPESLRSMAELIAEAGDTLPRRHRPYWRREALFDWRPVEPFRILTSPPESSRKHFWLRFKGRLSDDPAEHQRFLAYASDLHILHVGLSPLGLAWADDHLQTASLDHAIWFHDDFRADEWLLYALHSPASSGSRSLGRGTLFTADGRLIATTSQEGLIRLLPTPQIDKP